MTDTPEIPPELTPDDLRREATRRELVARMRAIADRRAARNTIAAKIAELDPAVVKLGRAEMAVKGAMIHLARAELADRDESPTHGDIHLAGPVGWENGIVQRVTVRADILEHVRHAEAARQAAER